MAGLFQVLQSAEVVVLLHVAAMAFAGWAVRARLEHISLGYGPVLKRFHLGGVPVAWRLLTLGGYVKFRSVADAEETAQAPDLEIGSWESLEPWQRVVVHLSGCVALVVASSFVLGLSQVSTLLGRGFQLIVHGAMTPTTVGALAVQRWLASVDAHGHLHALAVLGVAAAAFNLLPLPTLNGGATLWEILGQREPLPGWLALGSALLVFALLGAWSVAVLMAVR